MIYLDYNATTPVHPEVREAMLPYLGADYGNPSSAHRLGSRARCAIEDARDRVAELIDAHASEIVFTSGGTESNNLAVLGMAASIGRTAHMITTAIEHSSVLQAAAGLEEQGWRVTRLGVDAEGRVAPEQVAAALESDTRLVSIGWANNEIGTIQPVAEIGRICRECGVPLHVDAVQAAGKVTLVGDSADLLSLSAHKIGGPKGAGALRIRGGVGLRPVQRGGTQERGLRAGTENVAGIVGFGVACRRARDLVARAAATERLREVLWRGVAELPGLRRNSPRKRCLGNTLNLSASGVAADVLVAALDLRGIAVSAGSACAAGASEPSHVLRALGRDEHEARHAVRFSLGPETTGLDIDRVVGILREILAARKDLGTGEAANA